MSIISNVLNKFGYMSRRDIDRRAKEIGTFSHATGSMFSTLNTGHDKLKQPYKQHAWVYSCIRRLAMNVAGVPFKLYSGDANNPRLIESGPLFDVFNRPNNQWTTTQMFEAVVTFLSTGGTAVWVMDRERETREPRDIWPYPKDKFKPIYNNEDELMHWEFRKTSTKTLILQPYQVLLFKYFNPYNNLWGLAPLTAAIKSAEQDHLASNFNAAFFENGAHVGGTVVFKRRLQPEQRKQYLNMFDSKHKSAGNAFKTAFLEGEVEYKERSVSHKDMCFLEQKKWSRDEICAVFGVPKAELSIYEDINYATARSADKSFWTKTLVPICRLIESVLQSHFFSQLSGKNIFGRFDFSVVEALQEDFDKKVTRAKTLWDMGVPFNMINAKLDLGFEDIDSGGQGYLPMGLIEAGTTPPAVAAAQGIPSEKSIDGIKKIKGADVIDPEFEIVDKIIHTPAQEDQWRAFIKATGPMERKFNESVRKYLDRVKKWMGAQLAKYAKPKDIPLSALKLSAQWDKDLKSLAGKYYQKLAVSYGSVIEDNLSKIGIEYTFNVSNPVFVDRLKVKKNKIVGINDRMREKVTAKIANAAKVNQTMNELQETIFGTMKDTRARSLTIARTETAGVANELSYESYIDAGVKKHMWLAALDEVTRDSHLDAMGLGPISIGKVFGATGCKFPGDSSGAPEEVINCRCSLIAIK